MEDLLIEPVQRIPRYVLLIDNILKHLPPNHPDLSPCKEALTFARSFTEKLNELKRDADAIASAHALPYRVKGLKLPPIGPTAVRKLLREDRFEVFSRKGQKLKEAPLVYILLTDFLIEAKELRANSKHRESFLGKAKTKMRATAALVRAESNDLFAGIIPATASAGSTMEKDAGYQLDLKHLVPISQVEQKPITKTKVLTNLPLIRFVLLIMLLYRITRMSLSSSFRSRIGYLFRVPLQEREIGYMRSE